MPRENQVQFAFAPAPDDRSAPTIILGIPREAWTYMKDGQTHQFDLTKVGIPLKLILFGGKTQVEITTTLQSFVPANVPVQDARHVELSITDCQYESVPVPGYPDILRTKCKTHGFDCPNMKHPRD